MLEKSDLETNLARVHDWIKSADQKVSIFLAFQGVVLTILFTNVLPYLIENLDDFTCLNAFIHVVGIVLIGFSIYKSSSAIFPRLAKDTSRNSLTYFGDIARIDLKDFKKGIKDVSLEEYEGELIDQIHISSKIAVKKHVQFRDAIIAFFSGVLFVFIGFLIIIII